MSKRASKVVDGIHFIWVAPYRRSRLRGHWVSLNGKMQVRVYPPIKGGSYLTQWFSISAHAFGQIPGEVGMNRSHGHDSEEKAFEVALQFANYQ